MDPSILINANDINSQISSSESMIKKLENKIKDLKDIISKRQNPDLLKEENEFLKITHQLSVEDTKIYNEKISKLNEELQKNKISLLKLREENEKLKKAKNIKKQESKSEQNTILNVKDLYKSIGLKKMNFLKNNKVKNINNNQINNKINNKNENMEKINKKIKEYEKILSELKNQANQINLVMNKQNEIINGYRKYLNEVHGLLNKYRERLNISINNIVINNNNAQLNEFMILFEKVSLMLFELDDIILENKNNLGQNIENVLTNIQTNINDLKSDENKNELNFNNKCNEINQITQVIKIIFDDFKNWKNRFDTKNNAVEEEMKKLQNIQNQIVNQKKTVIQKNNEDNNIINEINKKKEENKNINNERREQLIKKSFLFNVKNASKKLDLLKTINLFKGSDESDKYIKDSDLIKKNYHEICYIYDDFEIYDIYYILKAVGLPDGYSYSSSGYSFYGGYKLEVQEFSLDDVPSQYKKESNSYISFKINLYNLDSIKVHIKFKAIKDLSGLSTGKLEERKIYRYGYYGLDSDLEGEKAKYSLILKGSFDIVNFEEYFLIRNINNKEEIEYMWGGIVPPGGNRVYIMFSKKEATWSFSEVLKLDSDSYIQDTKIYLPIEFVGGNNEIINITPSSPQATDIYLDEDNRRYVIEYINTRYKKVELIIKGELKNTCKGEWAVDLTDEEIEKLMPEEDVKCKEQLKKIAKKIINDFDKEHKNDDFDYLDYMKIAMWAKNNIKYDYNYTGSKHNALEIYNLKRGVCHHFTRLTNALLYSLGYKVIYVTGYCCKNSKTFNLDGLHAYSLIKLNNNKWFPFDSTWGIFTGKIHVGHVFRMFGNKNFSWLCYDDLTHKKEINGKFIK